MSLSSDEFEQNLLKSIDTLLEENSSQLVEHVVGGVVCEATDFWPAVVPKYVNGNSLLIDGQAYVKWSTVDSDEQIWPKRTQIPVEMNYAASENGGPSMLQQHSQYIAAAMNHTQQILNEYRSLLFHYNLIRNGSVPTPNIIDRLIYSINPNYSRIGNLLAASKALNWNIAASTNYSNHINLANQLNALFLQVQHNRGLCAGKSQANDLQVPKKH